MRNGDKGRENTKKFHGNNYSRIEHMKISPDTEKNIAVRKHIPVEAEVCGELWEPKRGEECAVRCVECVRECGLHCSGGHRYCTKEYDFVLWVVENPESF